MSTDKYIYADNAATTRLCDEALNAMLPFFTEKYGNPSSVYSFSAAAKTAVEGAREVIAGTIGAAAGEIIFTSGGTESDNHAIVGAAYANASKGKHIISTAIEHHAVLHTLKRLEKEGFEVTYLPVDSRGTVELGALYAAARPDTVLISVMAANNEIGTIQPLEKIGEFARERKILFHTDAVQAAGHIPLDVSAMNIDLLSLSAHKFNGPKGAGALYIRRGARVSNLVEGGGQERGRRSGTENVPGIVGMAAALKIAAENMESEAKRLSALRDVLTAGILKIPYTRQTGHPENRLPGICSMVIEYIEGESIILSLDLEGIAASTGSACSTGSLDPSHVLTAIGLSHETAHGSLRLSLGRYSTRDDVDTILEKLPSIVERLRKMSPVWPG